jgi:hypothetical protein
MMLGADAQSVVKSPNLRDLRRSPCLNLGVAVSYTTLVQLWNRCTVDGNVSFRTI